MADFLESKRLILRRLKEADAKDIFYNYATDPDVTKYLTWNEHENINVTESLLRQWVKEDENDYPNITRFGITLKGQDSIIGSIVLVKHGDDYEIGYVLSKKYWNKGYMSEALELFLSYLKKLGYKKVPITAQVSNIASNKVIQKMNGIFVAKEEIYLPLKNKNVQINSYFFDLK